MRGAGERTGEASLGSNVTWRGQAMPFRAFTDDDLLRFFSGYEPDGMLG
jgi:hypothetical protein